MNSAYGVWVYYTGFRVMQVGPWNYVVVSETPPTKGVSR